MIGVRNTTVIGAVSAIHSWHTGPLRGAIQTQNYLAIVIMDYIMNATEAQIKYIECLAIDLGFDRRSRNAYVSDAVGRTVSFLDQLTVSEASKAIDYLKRLKEGEA